MSAGLSCLAAALLLGDKRGDTSARIKKQPSENLCELQTMDRHFLSALKWIETTEFGIRVRRRWRGHW